MAERYLKTTETFVSGSMTLTQEYYISSEILSQEKEKLFNDWFALGT